jgi:hypothetical protein
MHQALILVARAIALAHDRAAHHDILHIVFEFSSA